MVRQNPVEPGEENARLQLEAEKEADRLVVHAGQHLQDIVTTLVAALERFQVARRAEDFVVQVDDKREQSEYGKFAWITDLDGNRIELWEPPSGT